MNKQIRLMPALAFGIALLSISTLANAEVILNVSEPTLIAKGAAVSISVQVTCNSGIDSQLVGSGVLTQRSGNSTTSAPVNLTANTVTCNGSPQNFDALGVVVSPGKPFKTGVAFLSFSVAVFNDFIPGVESGFFQQEIKINK
jgi:hypothetical protein